MEMEGVRTVGLVHDATHFWIRESVLDRTLPILARTMEETVPLRILPEVFGVSLSVPIKAELKVGDSWGEAKEVHIDTPWRQSMEVPQLTSPLQQDPHPDWDDHLPWDTLLRVAGPMLPHLRYLRKKGAVLVRSHKAPPTEPLRLWCRTGPGLWSHESEFVNARRRLLAGYDNRLKYALLEAWLYY
ncbi:MAG: hypothetical protein Q8R28_11980 [Dehalococcoidia bacterium]|nr:hypothetical protein [Dehalococcoidia bacterium]